jgi:hypothetical protein
MRPQPDEPTKILEDGPPPERELWPWLAVLFVLALAGAAAAWAVTRGGGGTAATSAFTPPAPAVPVARARTVTVQVTTSAPPTLPTVPNVVGDDERTAKQTLHDAGFDAKVERQDTTDPAQDKVVISQRPAAATQVSDTTRVTVYVGRYDHGHGLGRGREGD